MEYFFQIFTVFLCVLNLFLGILNAIFLAKYIKVWDDIRIALHGFVGAANFIVFYALLCIL